MPATRKPVKSDPAKIIAGVMKHALTQNDLDSRAVLQQLVRAFLTDYVVLSRRIVDVLRLTARRDFKR